MITDRDIYTAVNLMLKRFGRKAAIQRLCALTSLCRRAIWTDNVWLRIVEAINELSRQQPNDGNAIH